MAKSASRKRSEEKVKHGKSLDAGEEGREEGDSKGKRKKRGLKPRGEHKREAKPKPTVGFQGKCVLNPGGAKVKEL